MKILDDSGKEIGHWSWRKINDPKDLFPGLSENQYQQDLLQIVADIRSKIPNLEPDPGIRASS